MFRVVSVCGLVVDTASRGRRWTRGGVILSKGHEMVGVGEAGKGAGLGEEVVEVCGRGRVRHGACGVLVVAIVHIGLVILSS